MYYIHNFNNLSINHFNERVSIMKRFLILSCLVAVLFVVGCTDSTRANIGSYGKEHSVTMYNGGTMVRQWTSTGKVTSMTDSDGWQFMDKKTNKLVRVGGDVIIEVLR